MRFFLLFLPILLASCGQKPAETAKEKAKESPRLPKITHFYANAAAVPKGGSVTLCYGTEDVDSVTLTPSAESGLRPSFNRCVSEIVQKDTVFTLKVRGSGGETEAKVTVKIGAPTPSDAGERMMIDSFVVVGNTPVAPGAPVQLCYTTHGATSVSVLPAAGAPLQPGKNQCFTVHPPRSTNYVLTAKAADGAVDRMQVAVPVH